MRFFLLTLLPMSLLVLCLHRPSRGDDQFLRGYRVTRRHAVFGAVERSDGRTAVINFGYAHGLKLGSELLAVRSVDNVVLPVAALHVTDVHPGRTTVRVEGPFRVQAGDFVLIPAARLDLWGPRTRQEQLVMHNIVHRKLSTGYDTVEVTPELIDEVGRDDAFRTRQYKTKDWTVFVDEANRKAGEHAGLLGAVMVEPVRTATEENLVQDNAPDPTAHALAEFLKVATTPGALAPRLTRAALQQLTPLDRNISVSGDNPAMFSQILLAWTAKVLPPREVGLRAADAAPAEQPMPGEGESAAIGAAP